MADNKYIEINPMGYVAGKLGNKDGKLSDVKYEQLVGANYQALLGEVHQFVTEQKTAVLQKATATKETKDILAIVSQFISGKYAQLSADSAKLEDLSQRLVDDMLGFSFLERYFDQADDIEEININGWKDIIVIWRDGRKEHAENQFINAENAINVLNRILATHSTRSLDSNRHLDVTHLGKGIRIAMVTHPLVDEEIGVAVSIRFIHSAIYNMDKLRENGFVNDEIAQMLISMINYGVSAVVCGATGSGKTTLLNAVLQRIPNETRVLTLEGETREFDLKRYDENGKVVNDVVHLCTKPNRDEEFNVDLEKLVEVIMKFHPTVVAVGEMVSKEAYAASETSRTGHTVWSTIHCNSAEEAWDRMMSLSMLSPNINMDKEDLLKLMVEAFPISIYTRDYSDGQRRVESIVEGRWHKGENGSKGYIEYNELYRFVVTENIRGENGQRGTVEGYFDKVNGISDALRNKMLKAGIYNEELEIFSQAGDKE